MLRLVPVDAGMRAQMSLTRLQSPTGLAPEAAVRFAGALLLTPRGRTHLRHVALVDDHDRLLASALLHRRTALQHDQPVGACAVEDVTVHDASGAVEVVHALLAQVVTQVADLAPEARLVVATLAAGAPPPGFLAYPTLDLTLVVREDARRGAPMAPVRSGHRDDLGFIADYPPFGEAQHVVGFVRDASQLELTVTRQRLLAGLAPSGTRESWFLVVEEGMRAAAYAIISVTPGQWTIEECGDRDPTGARIGAILQTLIAREPAEHRPRITAGFPSALVPPQVEIVSTQPSPWQRCVCAVGGAPAVADA